ncbi:MAG TPA: phosphoribosylaminoimidazolesuccinocarboxamide synthase [Longimicrobiales bacterium]|nr:phosphoribosylaminoimidazolesuccinocarboxamide synthase [Longimicrobiales bacterium]
MSPAAAIARTELPFRLAARGKVRDVYDVGGDRLLIVATDRISAFDVVMAEPIPHKGEVLTQVTAWWLEHLRELGPDHLIATDPDRIVAEVPGLAATRAVWARRAMLVRRTVPFPVECVVRGSLSGSAWKEYRQTGTLAGEPLPPGLVESARLDPPIFSPATKAETGHDENITFDQMRGLIGAEAAAELRRRSLAIYQRGRELAERAGIIIADTKFEFGRLPDGRILLIDEVLTPDSSRFWPRETYAPGGPQPSLDKQPVRDYLEGLVARGAWNKEPPPPPLPEDVVAATSSRYRDLFRRLTGVELEKYRPPDGAAEGA